MSTPPPPPERLVSDRLQLRRWHSDDRAPFAAMNADPDVMRWFPATMTRERSDAFVTGRVEQTFAEGAGLWAVERRDTGAFVGFTGCMWQRYEAPFTPALEVGWRLAREHWGQGFAPEAATTALDDAFVRDVVPAVVSTTVVGNAKSRRVMEKLGMVYDPAEDFDHPNIADGPFRRHVLYRLTAAEWDARR